MHLVAGAAPSLEHLKYDVCEDLGFIDNQGRDPAALRQSLERRKAEVAAELGLDDRIASVGWPNMTSRECGMVGGHVGGPIGGQMVRRLIELAERRLG